MSQALYIAIAASDIPGKDGPSLASLAQFISDSAKGIRGCRAMALALSRRIDEVVRIIEEEALDAPNWQQAVDGLKILLGETLGTMSALNKRSVISQLLHLERDRAELAALEARLDIALESLKLQARVFTATLLATTQESRAELQTLERLEALALSHDKRQLPQETVDAAVRIPPKPPLFFGRAAETQAVVDSVTAGTPGHVAILGGPGMGKTTLALNALYQPSVAAHFGARRYFVDCSTAEGAFARGSLRVVAARLGILGTEPQAIQRALQFTLGGVPSLLVLDNFESAWEAADSRAEAEATLQFLAGIAGVGLIVTMRGAERPLNVQWARPFLAPLAPLSADAAAQVFLSLAESSGTSDTLAQLLSYVENVPLGVVLMANLAQSEPLNTLVLRWNSEKTRMLASGAGETRLTSLDVSISLSIRCPRMTEVPAALSLLRQLAMLPAGAAEADLSLWNGQDSRALATLLRVSLATRMPGQRTYVLAPIRSFVLQRMPASGEEVAVLKSYYFDLAATVQRDSQFPSQPEDIDLVVHEISNIEALIDHSLTEPDSPVPALQATAHLCRLHIDTGIPSGHHLLPRALEMAPLYALPELEGDLQFLSAGIGHNTGKARQAMSSAFRARDLYDFADVQGKYIDAALVASFFLRPEEALVLIPGLVTRAREINDSLRSVKCQGHLGSLYAAQGQWSRAISEYNAALSMHREAGLRRGRVYALITARLGECQFTTGNTAQAGACFQEALTISRPLRYAVLSGFCNMERGHIYLQQGYADQAVEYLEAASVPLRQWGSRDVLLVHALLAEAHIVRGDLGAALASAELTEQLHREMRWGFVYPLLAHGTIALHVGDMAQARAVLASLWAEWHDNRETLRSDAFVAAEHAQQRATLAQLEGDCAAASAALIVALVARHKIGTAVDIAITLAQLAEVVDDDAMAQRVLAAAMLPLLRFGYHLHLARALLQSARLALRTGGDRTAVHRARSAERRFQVIDNRDGCEKVASFLSELER
ncbi:hypothetical protein AURDEDRAFT_167738 [Auricularia subglabra TFB-10046 SS5]|nr:hypothetical protein AURDEDRAFT_167738 [Auricularia subglabra TFB-10046 SS5]